MVSNVKIGFDGRVRMRLITCWAPINWGGSACSIQRRFGGLRSNFTLFLSALKMFNFVFLVLLVAFVGNVSKRPEIFICSSLILVFLVSGRGDWGFRDLPKPKPAA
jgi:hypothetical protein